MEASGVIESAKQIEEVNLKNNNFYFLGIEWNNPWWRCIEYTSFKTFWPWKIWARNARQGRTTTVFHKTECQVK